MKPIGKDKKKEWECHIIELTRKCPDLIRDAVSGLATRKCFVLLGSSDDNTGLGVVFETGLIGLCRDMDMKRLDSWKSLKRETNRFLCNICKKILKSR